MNETLKSRLRAELRDTLRSIDMQIDVVNSKALKAGTVSYRMQDANGGWVLTPLLQARAQVLTALVTLESIEGKVRWRNT